MSDGIEKLAAANRRLDQWLWFARLAKSRAQATRLAAAGTVLVNGRPARKASQSVRPGDQIVVARGSWRRAVRVLALGTRRGPAAEARTLYEETTRMPAGGDRAVAWTPLLFDELGGPGGDAAN